MTIIYAEEKLKPWGVWRVRRVEDGLIIYISKLQPSSMMLLNWLRFWQQLHVLNAPFSYLLRWRLPLNGSWRMEGEL